MGSTFQSFSNSSFTDFSRRLQRGLSCISDTALALLDTSGNCRLISTYSDPALPTRSNPVKTEQISSPGRMLTCEQLPSSGEEIAKVVASHGALPHTDLFQVRPWSLFEFSFETGTTDYLAVVLRESTTAQAANGFLSMVWPVLRDDCLRDLVQSENEICDKAMHWVIAQRTDVAILVMNARGVMMRANAAAKRLLEDGFFLRPTPSGISCGNPQQTNRFRHELSVCAAADPSRPEAVFFLESADPGMRVPVTLSRYWHEGAATDLVTVMMPTPPDSRRVEMLARAVGLTPAEARVAALLQMGLSNKSAAQITGLKEQSVSTYAKRVLSKLNVTSRAEMAQLLTWQAGGGRL